MGLGHVINIKHMVFSRIRFNSRQHVQEWESDVGGNHCGVWGQSPGTDSPWKRSERQSLAVAAYCLAEPLMGFWAPFALVETGKQFCHRCWCQHVRESLCDQWPSCRRQNSPVVGNGVICASWRKLLKGQGDWRKQHKAGRQLQLLYFDLFWLCINTASSCSQLLWHMANCPHPLHNSVAE